ncbi:MAG: hypothetical protein AAGF87_13810 [Bacteroidota bacterium]
MNHLLDQFTEPEQKRLLDFLASPYFNKRLELVQLAKLMLARHSGKLKKEDLWASIFPDEVFEDVKLRLLKSDLLKLVEIFLTTEQAGELKDTRKLLQLKEKLRSKNLHKRYAAADRRLGKLNTKKGLGSEWAWLKYELQRESVRYKIGQRSTKRQDFISLHQQLENCYLIESLRMACQGLANQTIDPGQLEFESLRRALGAKDFSLKLEEDDVLAQYYYCYLMLSKPGNPVPFREFSAGLDRLKNWSKHEARDLVLLAVNSCIRRVNAGDPKAGNEALDLYQFGLDQHLLQDNGKLSRFTFNNIVALALKSENVERAGAFINTYSDQISPAYRQSTVALNLARLAYAKGLMNEAIDQLQSAKDQDVLTTLNIRVLQLRVYQQLAEQRLFDSSLDAFDIYLRRRKDSLDYHYKAYRKLVSYLRQFRRLNLHESEQLEHFKESIIREVGLPEKSWLLKLCDA